MNKIENFYLRKPQLNDLAEIKQAYQNSIHLHQPRTYPPTDFEQYLQQEHRYFVSLTENHAILQVPLISRISFEVTSIPLILAMKPFIM